MPSADLSLLLAAADWQQDAACRDADPDLFFSTDEHDRAIAFEFCAGCPVREPCLEQALSTGESYGIWGGTDDTDRRRILRANRRSA